MDRVLAETAVKERFTEHDLLAKVGSDAEAWKTRVRYCSTQFRALGS